MGNAISEQRDIICSSFPLCVIQYQYSRGGGEWRFNVDSGRDIYLALMKDGGHAHAHTQPEFDVLHNDNDICTAAHGVYGLLRDNSTRSAIY